MNNQMTFTPLNTPAQELGLELQHIITEASKWSPRSQQVYIGPSEVGQECVRRLAYKLLDWDKANESGGGSWAANVGTAIHSFLEDIFAKHPDRYEVEQRVQIRANLSGTVDLFDKEKGYVLDWKTTSPAGVKAKRSEGATSQQITQVQLYGYGKAQQGVTVNKVGLIFLPTGGSIDDMHIELFDYDEAAAIAALGRLDSVYELLSTIDVEENPQMWPLIPATPSRMCMYCPYYRPFSTDLSVACNGDTGEK
jgi:hypothetical protein